MPEEATIPTPSQGQDSGVASEDSLGLPAAKRPKSDSDALTTRTDTAVPRRQPAFSIHPRYEQLIPQLRTPTALPSVHFPHGDTLHALTEPFRCWSLPDFLQATLPASSPAGLDAAPVARSAGQALGEKAAADEAVTQSCLHQLRLEALQQPMRRKNNDLYAFAQSDDLRAILSRNEASPGHSPTPWPALAAIREVLEGPIRRWMQQVTGIELNERVAMTISLYKENDVLLCHDDELEERRIAFILYLTPEWDRDKDGGQLDLFSCDAFGQPDAVVASLAPAWNTFNFFEVTEKSHHQVREVATSRHPRLSINGWFHGAPLARAARHVEPKPERVLLSAADGAAPSAADLLAAWINPAYLDPRNKQAVRQRFVDESSVELQKFIAADKWDELCREAQSSPASLSWTLVGPPNRRRFWQLSPSSLAPNSRLRELHALCHSPAFASYLSEITGLAPRSAALSISRFSHGSYTLLHDTDASLGVECLDALLYTTFSPAAAWGVSHGGFVSYLAKDEDEELLTVPPVENSLTLVYRTADTMRFTKFVNRSAPGEFVCVAGEYFE